MHLRTPAILVVLLLASTTGLVAQPKPRSLGGPQLRLGNAARRPPGLKNESADKRKLARTPKSSAKELVENVLRRVPTPSGRRVGFGAGTFSIDLDEVIDGELAGLQTDEYSFHAAPGQAVLLDRISTDQATRTSWRLEDRWQRVIIESPRMEDLGPVALLGGEYRLVLTHLADGPTEYSFRVADATAEEREVALSEEIQGSVVAGEADTFAFTAAPEARLFFNVLETDNPDLSWRVEDALGRQVVVGDLEDLGPVSLVGGAYRLIVSGSLDRNGNVRTGTYRVLIDEARRTEREISIGELVAGELSSSGAELLYRFAAPAAQKVSLDVTQASAGLECSLTDRLGRELIANEAFGDSGPFTLLGGEYTLSVRGEAGSFAFRIVDASPSVQELALGTSVLAEIPADAPGRSSIFELDVSTGQIVSLGWSEVTNLSLRFTLEDPRGLRLFESRPLIGTLTESLQAGVHRLTVSGRIVAGTAATGSFRLTLGDEGSSTFVPGGTPTMLGAELDGMLAAGSEERFLLAASAGDQAYFDVLERSDTLVWELFDPVGRSLFSKRGNSTFAGDAGPFVLGEGDYTVVLSGTTASATPTYQLALRRVTDEENAAVLDAEVNGSFAGSIGATHTYLFEATEGQELYFDLLTNSRGLEWSLLDPVGEPVFDRRIAGFARLNDEGPLRFAQGAYRLVFDMQGDNSSDYDFAIREVSRVVNEVAIGELQEASFAGNSAGTLAFRFDVEEGEKIFLDRVTPSNQLTWSLLDPVAQPVFEGESANRSTDDQGPFALAGGSYTLLFETTPGNEPDFDFRLVSVTDSVAPLSSGELVEGEISTPGGEARYTFSAAEGERVLLELTSGQVSLRWSLFDELGTPVFNDLGATRRGLSLGPVVLSAGDYELVFDGRGNVTTPFAFTFSRIDVDLSLESVTLSPAVVAADADPKLTEISWTIENLGGGFFADSWNERVTLSTDDRLGGDDLVLLEVTQQDPIAPHRSYTRRYDLELPTELTEGIYWLFVEIDTDDAILEPGGEADNVASTPLAVGPSAEADEPFVTASTFPVDFSTGRDAQSLDLRLTRTVSLLDKSFVNLEALKLEIANNVNGAGAEARVTAQLLSGSTVLLDMDSVEASTSGRLPTSFVVRFSTALSREQVASLRRTTVDGVRLVFDQPATTRSTVTSIHDDGQGRLHFSRCQFSPCGPHVEREAPGGTPIELLSPSISDWQLHLFDESVVGDTLRFVDGPVFSAGTTSSIFSVTKASSEVELVLDDGSFVALNDSRSPSTQETPAFQLNGISASHALELAPDELAGRQILGFRWRVHLGGTGGTALYTPPDPMVMSFLYDSAECSGLIDQPPTSLLPADASRFPAGSRVTLSGRALMPEPGRPVSAVLVNGMPVDTVDAAGRFFKSVEIAQGPNLFAVGVTEPGCGESERLITLHGTTPQSAGFDSLGEVTAWLEAEYSGTTFNRTTQTLAVDVTVRNVGTQRIETPLLLVVSRQLHPTVELLNPVGHTPERDPYVLVLEDGELGAGESAPPLRLYFRNPDRLPVRFEERWLAPIDTAPQFETSPDVTARAGESYLYAARARDSRGEALSYAVLVGPEGLSIDPRSGDVEWSPEARDIGSHEVVLEARNGRGGRAEQAYTLSVVDSLSNRAPVFVTAPRTQAPIGSSYRYDADAADFDGDAVTFALEEGPAGLVLDPAIGLLTWDFALPGAHAVTLTAEDGRGGGATQAFVLSVGQPASNPSGPVITGVPSPTAVVDVLYVYQPVTNDPDGDVLDYALEASPDGMTIDPLAGRLEWVPTADQVGAQRVSLLVDDGRGGTARQDFDIQVIATARNLAPVFETTPPRFASVGALWEYLAEVTDPNGDAVTFRVETAPTGLSIDAATGRATWTPTAGDTGRHTVALVAEDALGATGQQVFQLEVRDGNVAPVVTSEPPRSVLVGAHYQYGVTATDADGDVLRYELEVGPVGMTVQPIVGLVDWDPTSADVGVHSVVVRVSDCCGGSAVDAYELEVLPDDEPPEVAISFSESPTPVAQPIVVAVGVADNVGIELLVLTVECGSQGPVSLDLDATGRAQFQSERPGICTFEATVRDPSGNETVVTETLTVGDPGSNAPLVTLVSPSPGSLITAPTDIRATIHDDAPELLSWEVSVARQGREDFELIGEGSGEVIEGVVARFDPTRLPNDVYRLRIIGSDGARTGGIEFDVSVGGEFKLGNFEQLFTDLRVEMNGAQFTITRRYDSLDCTPGDFGVGWRLGLVGDLIDSARESDTGNGLVDLLGSEPFRPGTRVHVTRPDGRRIGFTFAPQQLGGLVSFLWAPIFTPDPGVEDVLEVLEPAGNVMLIGGAANQIGIPYNPRVYRLTTREGLSYTIDEVDGLELIEDRSGNTIEVRPDGLFSSTGTAILFERDAEGRIEKIIEPTPDDGGAPGELEYFYDGIGNLVESRDQLENSTTYFYEDDRFPHYLSEVRDPLDRPTVRSVFDEGGKLIAQCDALGDVETLEGCTLFESSASDQLLTIINARGFRTDYLLDERGNVLLERRWLDEASSLDTARSYDESGHLLSETDPDGNTTSFTYDERGNRLTRTDPGGNTRTATYNDCDLVASQCDELGNCSTYTYDEACRLISIEDALGETTRYAYNERGQRIEITDPVGNRWQIHYAPNGLFTGITDPAGQRAEVSMNALGEVESIIERDGRRIDLEYDEAHRLVTETWDTDPPTVHRLTYNEASEVTRVESPDSVTVTEFWPTGLLKSVDNTGTPGAPGVVNSYGRMEDGELRPGYDPNGNVTHVLDSEGGITEYEYDPLDRLVSIRQSGREVTAKRVDLAYGGTQLIRALTRFADLAGTRGVASSAYEYDCTGCPTTLRSIHHRRASDGAVLHDLDFTRDALGNILEMSDFEGIHRYVYDGLRRLVEAEQPDGGVQADESYRYDAAGNRVESHLSSSYLMSYAEGVGGSQLLSDDGHDYEYSPGGMLARKTSKSSGEFEEYGYDHRQRMTSLKRFLDDGTLLLECEYAYDFSNRRIRTSENGRIRHHVYDGANPVLVLDDEGEVTTRRLYSRAIDGILADEVEGTTRWFLTDQVGTVRDLVSDDGTVLNHYVYDSFGQLLSQSDPSVGNEILFTGREFNSETGLGYFRARYYNPQVGRFLHLDPRSPFGYEYASNNPNVFNDPGGQVTALEVAIVITLVGLELTAACPVLYFGGANGSTVAIICIIGPALATLGLFLPVLAIAF